MKYDVHLFALVRVKVPNVGAPNERKAAKAAERLVNLNGVLDTTEVSNPYAAETEFADTITHILVEPAGNGKRDEPKEAVCFESFGKGGLTEVPFEDVSTHVAVIVEGGNIDSVVTNRPCQVAVLDRDHAKSPNYDPDEETAFHDSEVDPWLRCQDEFKQYRRTKAHARRA